LKEEEKSKKELTPFGREGRKSVGVDVEKNS